MTSQIFFIYKLKTLNVHFSINPLITIFKIIPMNIKQINNIKVNVRFRIIHINKHYRFFFVINIISKVIDKIKKFDSGTRRFFRN